MDASMSPTDDAMMDPAAYLVGPGCADYAEAVPEGEGSVAGMAEDPVAVELLTGSRCELPGNAQAIVTSNTPGRAR